MDPPGDPGRQNTGFRPTMKAVDLDIIADAPILWNEISAKT